MQVGDEESYSAGRKRFVVDEKEMSDWGPLMFENIRLLQLNQAPMASSNHVQSLFALSVIPITYVETDEDGRVGSLTN